MDVCVTKDDVLVVHHDLDLNRTCGVHKLVRDVNAEDLPKLKGDIELQFAEEGHRVTTGNESIPTLQEVFEKFPQMPMNIELKTSSQSAIATFVRLLNQHKRIETTIIGIRK
jgi:glycerophosphoryl diester phosphodiesterase